MLAKISRVSLHHSSSGYSVYIDREPKPSEQGKQVYRHYLNPTHSSVRRISRLTYYTERIYPTVCTLSLSVTLRSPYRLPVIEAIRLIPYWGMPLPAGKSAGGI